MTRTTIAIWMGAAGATIPHRVIPYLLCAATGGAEPSARATLADLRRGIDTNEPVCPTWEPDGPEYTFDDENDVEWEGGWSKPRPVQLTPFLRSQLQRRPPQPESRDRFLKVAWNIAQKRVKTS